MKTKKTICIINPNTSSEMTNGIAKVAKKIISSNFDRTSTSPEFGPESIEGYYDEAFCIPGLVEEIEKHSDADSYIIACFDDTGLEVIRSITQKPVIGIGEAAYHIATMVAGNFTVITTLSRSIRPLTHNLKKYGLFENCVKVTAIEAPVLDLENISRENLDKLNKGIQDTIENDNAESIILGCAGMADLAKSLETKHQLPVIEGVSSAVVLAESLVNLKIKTSKVGSYAVPRKKEYMGYLNKFKP